MPLLIKGGEIVNATDKILADIYCENETITRIASTIDDHEIDKETEIIDARGKLVFPGFIDPHTHLYLPLPQTSVADNFKSGTKAALCGGTTTVFDFIGPNRNESPIEAQSRWEKEASQSYCDVGFHLAISQLNENTEMEIRQIVADGHRSFKVYLAYEAIGVNDSTLFRTLELAKELGVLTLAHCENEALVSGLARRLVAQGKTGPRWHYHSRPPRVEALGTRLLLSFAELIDAEIYIVHLSCTEALEEVLTARKRGVRAHIETLMQFLLLSRELTESDSFEAAKYVASPPLRDKENHAPLWSALCNGSIDTLGTDHAPFNWKGQKELGKDDFRKIPNGLPTIEDRANLLFTHGVKRGRMNPERFIEIMSTNAARLFGLFPRKGTLSTGSDADIVVYDPNYRGTISAKNHHMNVDYNPFEGYAIEGRSETVIRRGEICVREGEFIATEPKGNILRR